MNLIQNNPYRIVGLLVGATAKEQDRQIRRLKQFIEAEQEPQEDFSFPTLGNLNRTLDSVTEAVSKLNLDRDKINAALFWFWKGYAITDEPAFEAIKEGNLDQVRNLWKKLATNGEVSQHNASAHSNLSTLYLSGVLDGTNTDEAILEQGVSLKLKFLESDFVNNFIKLVTDETYKITKKDLQLLFLNQLQPEIERKKKVSSSKFLEILTKQTFLAKEDFLKGFVQKPIKQLEKYVETAKTKRKANKANAATAGKELYLNAVVELTQLKSILSTSDIKYSSAADKVANEILQCSIDYFNGSQGKDSNSDCAETAMKLAKQAETIAVGNLTKDRVKDSINTLAAMKDRELSQAITALQAIKNAYEEACSQIDKQVDELLFDTFPSIDGSAPMRRPKFNVSINWDKVEKAKQNAIDWKKVIVLIQEVIPPENVEKIEKANNPAKLNEYKILIIFIMSKLSYLQKNKVRYLSFWENQGSAARSTSGDIEKIPNWIKWVGGIILLLILIRACN